MGCTQGSHWPLSFRRSGDADTDTSSPQRSWRAGGAQSEVTEYVEGTQMSKVLFPRMRMYIACTASHSYPVTPPSLPS